MGYDFCGWATRNNIQCSDGRTIRKDAFKHNDGQYVPLVWNHQHGGITNVLGRALLENMDDGVYTYGEFNSTPEGQRAKEMVMHQDITKLSIYANELQERGKDVIHGSIKEVSLVLAGANPGAVIETVIEHSDYEDESAIIRFDENTIDQFAEDDELSHAEKGEAMDNENTTTKTQNNGGDKTIGEIMNTLNEEQKKAVYVLIQKILEDKDNPEGGKEEMKHNLFENEEKTEKVLSHSDVVNIFSDAPRYGSLKDSFLAHAAEYGIDGIETLFPEYQSVNGTAPEFIKRNPDGWVDVVMKGVHHTPFSRIKMMYADIREDEARAKGYIKGNLKKEEVFGLLKRVVEPTTVYKKQKLDRDDAISITDFDIVAWLKAEMRMMLDEELARAFVFGDGRSALSEDKIKDTNIIPIIKDSELFTIHKEVDPEANETFSHAFVNACVKAQDDYQGSGNTILFTASGTVTDIQLEEDADGHRMYKDIGEIALACNVNKIVKVPAAIIPDGIYGVIVDLNDYNVGADKGGSVNLFDDFDINYNQMIYLIETRCSGALTRPFSAIVLEAAD